MRVKILRAWFGHEVGKIIDCPETTGKFLIREKFAKAIKEPPRDKMMRMVKTK